MKTLEEMKKELKLTPTHIMLLANTGSMTVLLEALFGRITVETVVQEVIDAEPEIAKTLDIGVGESINHRIVKLVGNNPHVHATSASPLSRLKGGFRNDIMRLDTPIGMIMMDYSMESRREVLGFDWFRANREFEEIFSIPRGSLLLKRNYNIIYMKKPLINITEIFPYEMVEAGR